MTTDLWDQNALLNAFVQALPGNAFVISEEGRHLKIMNTRMAHLHNLTERFTGHLISDILSEEESTPILKTIAKVLHTNEPTVLEYTVTTMKGVARFEARVAPLILNPDPANPTRAVVWITHDVTDRKRALESLEQSNKDLENFAYVASHDLRSPLRAISQLTQWIEEDMGDKMDEESTENFGLLKQRVERMDNLIVALLEYSRTATGFSPQQTPTLPLIQNIIDLLAPDPQRFTLQLDPNLPTITTDPVLFRQVLQNLIDNAIKHHDKPHGTIAVTWSQTKDHLTFSIADDGPGIPEQFRERIFTMFQTLKPRDELEAAGIGLAIVQKALLPLGGTIHIETNHPHGTIFHITLPKAYNHLP